MEQFLTNTHPGARASCNFYTACRFIHELHTHLPTLDCALAEAGCPEWGEQHLATMTSRRGSKNLPTRPHPLSTRQCKGGTPIAPIDLDEATPQSAYCPAATFCDQETRQRKSRGHGRRGQPGIGFSLCPSRWPTTTTELKPPEWPCCVVWDPHRHI